MSSGRPCKRISTNRILKREQSYGEWKNHLMLLSLSLYLRAHAQPDELSHSCFKTHLNGHLLWGAFPYSTRDLNDPLRFQNSLYVLLLQHLNTVHLICLSLPVDLNSLDIFIVFYFFNWKLLHAHDGRRGRRRRRRNRIVSTFPSQLRSPILPRSKSLNSFFCASSWICICICTHTHKHIFLFVF